MLKDGLKTYGWILLWLSLLLTALVSRPPLPIDETRYLSVAWEMWQSQQFLVPHINGIPYSHKPPLLFWLIGAGWSIFGVNEWSARLTAPIFGLFVVLLAIRLSRMLWPDEKKLHKTIPYLLLGTCFWSFYGTLTMFDMLIACFSIVAWMSLWSEQGKRSYLCWILFGAATGLGILAKGPVILVYILPPALLAPWWMEKGNVHSWTGWYGGLILAITAGIMLALTWAIPAAIAGGEQYGQAILFGQTAGRVVQSFAHQRPFYWYLLLLPLLFFPWAFCLPVWSGIKRMQLTAPVKFCLSIIGPAFLLFSVISGKQVHYLLPLVPVALLLVGHGLSTNSSSTSLSHWLLPLALLFFSLALLIIPVLHLQGGDSEMLRFLPRWLGIGPLTAAFVLYRSTSNHKQMIVKTSVILTGLLIFFHVAMAGTLHTLYDATDVGARIRNARSENVNVAVFPAQLSDQFQFAGKLVAPVAAQQSFGEAIIWSMQNPDQAILLFLDNETSPYFADMGDVRPYSNGWLIFRSTNGFFDSFEKWMKEIDPE
jgi:4-amino-4-deoxy-L-arabinose transferase-like glycosyltransferase